MTNRDMLRENMEAARDHTLTFREQKQLEEYRQATAHSTVMAVGSTASRPPTAWRCRRSCAYLRYHEVYGKRQRAAELYQALPPEARKIAGTDLAAAQSACPHGLPLVELLHRADRQMS